MANAQLVAGLPPGLDLTGGYTIRFSAIDPVTGADVADVFVYSVAIEAVTVSADSTADSGVYELIPGQES